MHSSKFALNFLQLNCRKNKAVSALLEEEFNDVDILMLTEPPTWNVKNNDGLKYKKIPFNINYGIPYYKMNSYWPKSCIVVKKEISNQVTQVDEFCDEHFTTIKIKHKNKNNITKIIEQNL
jgi:hypothetical protein